MFLTSIVFYTSYTFYINREQPMFCILCVSQDEQRNSLFLFSRIHLRYGESWHLDCLVFDIFSFPESNKKQRQYNYHQRDTIGCAQYTMHDQESDQLVCTCG